MSLIDPIISIAVAIFILLSAIRNLKEALGIFLEKAPKSVEIEEITEHILKIEGVLDVHHIHIWSMDGQNNYATMHIVAEGDNKQIKKAVRSELLEHGIGHATLELEEKDEHCHDEHCHIEFGNDAGHHHRDCGQ